MISERSNLMRRFKSVLACDVGNSRIALGSVVDEKVNKALQGIAIGVTDNPPDQFNCWVIVLNSPLKLAKLLAMSRCGGQVLADASNGAQAC